MYRAKIWAVLLLAFAFFSSCSRPSGDDSADSYSHPEEISSYGITLTKDSSPEEVAAMLIKGLDSEDTGLLRKLVAVRHEKKEIEAIYGRHGKKSSITFDKAAGLAAAGWQLTYSFLKKGQTAVTQTVIHEDTATVYATAKGRTNMENRYIRISLVKEDGWWKARAGIQE